MSFQRLLNFVGRNVKDVAKSVVPNSAITAGFGLLESPQAAAVYGLSDLALSIPATLAARGVGARITKPVLGVQPETLRGGLELATNVGAQLGSTMAAGKILYGDQQATSPAMLQDQQTMQRTAINNLKQQTTSPGTQFQMTGLPSPDKFQSLLNQQNNWTKYLSPQDLALVQQSQGAVA